MATGTLTTVLLLLTLGTSSLDNIPVYPMKDRSIRIPVTIDAARRSQIKELILFSSADEGRNWNQVAVASRDQTEFQFVAPMDGLYWFTLQIVFLDNTRLPVDIYHEPPSEKVLIDTLKPALRIVSSERQGDDILVRWEIQEEHPDLATLKLEYRTSDASQWYAAPVNQATSGESRFRVSGPGPVSIRMSVQDKARNEANASAEIAASAATSLASSVAPEVRSAASPAAVNNPSATPSFHSSGGSSWESSRASQPSPISRADPFAREDARPNPIPPAAPVANLGSRMVATPENYSTPSAPAPSSSYSSMPHGPLPEIQKVNSTQVAIDYEVNKKGPSGLGKVELWLTTDEGQTWKKYAEDAGLQSPLNVELPGEGVYGLTLVLRSRVGLGKHPPLPGDPPQMRIEVDMTPPIGRLSPPEPDPKRRDFVLLKWEASDKNLTFNPITLEWAERPTGPWTIIAPNLVNTGQYSWQVPPDLPVSVYMRMKMRDQAGNVGVYQHPETVILDLVEPEGRIREVRPTVVPH